MVSLYLLKNTLNIWNTQESLPVGIFHFYQTNQRKMSKKEAPQCICLSAVFTLEAAVVLPLAACFLVSILYFFRVIGVEMEVQNALDNTSRQLAVYDINTESENLSSVISANIILANQLQNSSFAKQYIKGGIAGIHFISSDLAGEDIRLNVVYQVVFPVQLLGKLQITIKQNAECRKWIGWSKTDALNGQETWVYITKSGSVYHTQRECTSIMLSVQTANYTDVENLRNNNGERYRECEHCKEEKKKVLVYITNQGDCYHYDRNCSGIKRTVFKIRLSDAKDRPKCRKCGT